MRSTAARRIIVFTSVRKRTSFGALQCLLRVTSGHDVIKSQCPLYPLKRTSLAAMVMSALCQKQTLRLYSITSSARARSAGGTARSSAFAVLRLMASSNLVGVCTGRSAGFSPLRMRST